MFRYLPSRDELLCILGMQEVFRTSSASFLCVYSQRSLSHRLCLWPVIDRCPCAAVAPVACHAGIVQQSVPGYSVPFQALNEDGNPVRRNDYCCTSIMRAIPLPLPLHLVRFRTVTRRHNVMRFSLFVACHKRRVPPRATKSFCETKLSYEPLWLQIA